MNQAKFDKVKFKIDESGGWLCLRVPAEYRQPARAFAREMLEGKLYIGEFRRYRERRSLDANAYCWVLLQKLAQAIGSDKNTLYLEMIERYGVFVHIIIKPQAAESLKRQYKLVRELGEVLVNGKTGIQFQCYIGSSQYDAAEMARFIDGIIQECKDLDIETETPDEIARMKREWNNAQNDKSV